VYCLIWYSLVGTGGVSLMALKLARSVGCNIIVTSSSDEKLQKIKNMTGYGSVSTINYVTTPDWDIEAIKLNGGRGVDILVENGGAASLLKSVNATASRGIVSLVGYLGTQDPSELKALVPNMIEKATNIRCVVRPELRVGISHAYVDLTIEQGYQCKFSP
jgi:NADPH:quinone reductase-like Zn-dependent oxidoreductase